MILKKQIDKRAKPPRESNYTKHFLKDWKRLERSSRYNMNKLKEIMLLIIANNEALPSYLLDHQLTSNWDKHREFHIGGYFLLVYKVDDAKNMVIFSRCGTNAEIFE